MRAVIQRVKSASVEYVLEGKAIREEIGRGLQVMLGVTHEDLDIDLKYIIDKIEGLRIFEDENEKMNLSLSDIGGEILLVSQFTLYGDARKGKRPSFTNAAHPNVAIPLYEMAQQMLEEKNIPYKTGYFGADMLVSIQNDGPVTILLDSKKIF